MNSAPPRSNDRRRRATGRLARLGGDTRGAAIVEFAIVSLPFLMLFFAIFEQALIFYKHEILQSAVSSAGRLILTGQANSAGYNKEQFRQKICAQLPSFIDCSTISVDVRPYSTFTTARPFEAVNGSGTFDPSTTGYNSGTAGSIVVVSAYSLQRTFFPLLDDFYASEGDGKVLISAIAAFRNEPFSA